MSRGSAKMFLGPDRMCARLGRLTGRISCRHFRLMAVFLFWAGTARAEALVADLTNHLIAITTGFTGASVVLFGAIDGPGDVAVVVRGPDRDVTVRRKSRFAGIWVNSEEVIFGNVPSFYFVAASRPLEEIVSPAIAAFYRLGVTNLEMKPEGMTPPRPSAMCPTATWFWMSSFASRLRTSSPDRLKTARWPSLRSCPPPPLEKLRMRLGASRSVQVVRAGRAKHMRSVGRRGWAGVVNA